MTAYGRADVEIAFRFVYGARGNLFGAHASLAYPCEDLGQILALDFDGEDVAGAYRVRRSFNVELIRSPSQLLARDRNLALAHVRGKVDAERTRALRKYRPALGQIESLKLRRGLHVDVEAAAAGRVEAVTL